MINRLCNKATYAFAATFAPVPTTLYFYFSRLKAINDIQQHCFNAFDHRRNPSLCYRAADSHSYYWIACAISSAISVSVLCAILRITWSSLQNEQQPRPLPHITFLRTLPRQRLIVSKAAAAA